MEETDLTLVTLTTLGSLPTAHVIKDLLSQQNIESWILEQHGGAHFSSNSEFGARIRVQKVNYIEANKLLMEFETLINKDTVIKVGEVEYKNVLADCPKCNSSDVYAENKKTILFTKKKHICKSCNNSWEALINV